MQQTQTFSTARGEYGLMTHDDHRTISQGKSFQQAKQEGFSVESLCLEKLESKTEEL